MAKYTKFGMSTEILTGVVTIMGVTGCSYMVSITEEIIISDINTIRYHKISKVSIKYWYITHYYNIEYSFITSGSLNTSV